MAAAAVLAAVVDAERRVAALALARAPVLGTGRHYHPRLPGRRFCSRSPLPGAARWQLSWHPLECRPQCAGRRCLQYVQLQLQPPAITHPSAIVMRLLAAPVTSVSVVTAVPPWGSLASGAGAVARFRAASLTRYLILLHVILLSAVRAVTAARACVVAVVAVALAAFARAGADLRAVVDRDRVHVRLPSL